jgi:TPP-dependent 2-oxoacid decarboxylase
MTQTAGSAHILQERIKTVDRAAEQVDLAVSEALRRRRPVLIEVGQGSPCRQPLLHMLHPSK